MASRPKKNCSGEVDDIMKYCYNPKVCVPRAIPIKNQNAPPSFFAGSGNNPQFLLTQAGKYSFLANPVTSSRKRSTIFIKIRTPPIKPTISNNLY